MSARIQRVLTGQSGRRDIGPEKAHELTVLAVTKKIHKKVAQLRAARLAVAALRRELKHDRRELRALLQRDSSIDLSGDNPRLELAGKADATDRRDA